MISKDEMARDGKETSKYSRPEMTGDQAQRLADTLAGRCYELWVPVVRSQSNSRDQSSDTLHPGRRNARQVSGQSQTAATKV
jgi:hypothetical protein